MFNVVMSKWLKVEKKSFFSSSYVNEKHKKIDWTLRMTCIIIFILGNFINIERNPTERIWMLEPWNVLFGLIILTEVVRAYMEWKYEENKNVYIFTLSQCVFSALLVILIIKTNFLGIG